MKTNLEIARECGAAILYESYAYKAEIRASTQFRPAELDAFAERIRADAVAEYVTMTAKGAKAWADVPDATAWVDDLRGG